MQTGFNHNIKHQGRLYHVQTEDSGLAAPHIITHLFVGGNILATRKTSYADVVGTQDIDRVVRQMMEDQHKEMLRNLIHGVYDQAITERLGGAPAGDGDEMPPRPAAAAAPALAQATTPPPARAPTAPLLTSTAPASIWDVATPQAASPRALAPAPRRVTATQMPAPVLIPDAPEARLAALPPEVLAARELKVVPVEKPAHDTIFGEDLLSEKSLDEVILAYLADDIESGG